MQILSDRRQMALVTGLVILSAILVGSLDTSFGAMIALAVVLVWLLLQDNLWAYYLTMPVMILLGNLGISIPFPLLSSPTDLLVSIGVLFVIVQTALFRRNVPRTWLYLPIMLFAGVALAQALALHAGSPVHTGHLTKLIRGMWPFPMLILGLHTPRQARNVLIALLGTMLAATLLWLPGFLYAAVNNDLTLLRAANAPRTGNFLIDLTLTNSLRTYLFIVPLGTLAAIPLAFVVMGRRLRPVSFLALLMITLIVLASSIASGIVGLIQAIFVLLILSAWFRPRQKDGRPDRRIVRTAITVGGFVVVMLLVIAYVPIAAHTFDRVLELQTDASGSARLKLLDQAFAVFLESPLIGYQQGNYWYGGHDSILTMLANWGLAFSLPYLLTLFWAAWAMYRLAQRRARPVEQALLVGMAACVIANILVSVATPNLIELFADLIIWSFLGLLVVWMEWQRRDPAAPLIA